MRVRRVVAVALTAVVAFVLMATTVLAGVDTAEDSFATVSYGGGSGWTGGWTESGESTNPTSGVIRVVNSAECYATSCVSFGSILSVGVGLQRSADFSGAETLTLSFRYKKAGVGTLEVWAGQTAGSVSQVQTLNGAGSYQSIAIDISDAASATTTIRFFSTVGLLSSAYVDNVAITATYPTTTTTTPTTSSTTTTPTTTTTTTPIITLPTVTLPSPSTTTTTPGATTTTSGTAGTTTTTTTAGGGPGGGSTDGAPPRGSGGEDDPGTVDSPLTEEEVEFAADNNVVVNLAAGVDFGGFGSGPGINPLTDLWANLNTTVETISTEILSAIALGSMITFFGVRRIRDDEPLTEPEDPRS